MIDPMTKTLELEVAHTKHEHDRFSITITTRDTHVSLSSHPYPHCSGNRSTIDIFSMTPDDILKLGNLIIVEAFKVKGLQEAGNADPV